ncbi:(6-4)DNA photolyase-like, partial [Trifolium medium]|nr:(6-4)DNA photolyase-like [Trifolium medium]
WNIGKLCFEYDTDPYYQALDIKIKLWTLLLEQELRFSLL